MTDLQKLVKEFTDALIASEEYQELKKTCKGREYVYFWMDDCTFNKGNYMGGACGSSVHMPDWDDEK